jgi:alginate O-acetyltransferase complex protein AlgI
MLFNSIEFIYLLIVTFILYYLPPLRRFQIFILTAASLIFYAYHDPALLSLLIVSILVNAICSYGVLKSDRRKMWATTGVAINLGLLIVFKYNHLLVNTFLNSWRHSGNIVDLFAGLPLPIGISFFTFQGISLMIDVYRNPKGQGAHGVEVKDFKSHLIKTAFFKAFFPQLIAGPIVKAHDFYYQIASKKFSEIPWDIALKNLVLGYFLKSVIADNLKDQTYWIMYPYFKTLSSFDLVFMLFGYSMQIFADFAGYTYIAIGCAYLFGYTLPINFNWPYISTTFSEFWNRWHISLSSFLKEYLYIPLGGNRKGPIRTYFNLFVVMFLGGLWHGAAWSYAVWGSFHGIMLAIERFLTGQGLIKNKPEGLEKYLRMAFTFAAVSFAWLLFKLPHFSDAVEYVQAVLQNTHGFEIGKTRILLICVYSAPIILLHFYQLLKNRFYVPIMRFESLYYAALLFLILVNRGTSGEFIYFQF